MRSRFKNERGNIIHPPGLDATNELHWHSMVKIYAWFIVFSHVYTDKYPKNIEVAPEMDLNRGHLSYQACNLLQKQNIACSVFGIYIDQFGMGRL